MAVRNWVNDPTAQQVFRLFGYAGTGKTTLAKHFAEDHPGHFIFAAFTGKATHVLKKKGCWNASTIHALIYKSREKSKVDLMELEKELAKAEAEKASEEMLDKIQRMIAMEKKNLSRPYFELNPESLLLEADVLCVDECSMVDEWMGNDILSFGKKVLVLGDPAQLPPVKGGGFFTEGKPDIMLDEIHRQALDNPILAMATMVRERKQRPPLGSYGESSVQLKAGPEEALTHDQILVGRNATRHASNVRMRFLHGLPADGPIAGDKLVCLRNNHEKSLLNGSIWKLIRTDVLDEETLLVEIEDEDEQKRVETMVHRNYFTKGKPEDMPWWERTRADEFDYGYALTVHKSQGSQWDNVLLFDESSAFRSDWWRWLYTGITRAAEKVTIVG